MARCALFRNPIESESVLWNSAGAVKELFCSDRRKVPDFMMKIKEQFVNIRNCWQVFPYKYSGEVSSQLYIWVIACSPWYQVCLSVIRQSWGQHLILERSPYCGQTNTSALQLVDLSSLYSYYCSSLAFCSIDTWVICRSKEHKSYTANISHFP